MWNILRGTTLALMFACAAGIAAAQQPVQQQGGQPAQDMQKEGQGKGVAPSDDQTVGPPEAEAGQRDPKNLAGDPSGDPDGEAPRAVPGATGETSPAKFSAQIAAQDEIPTMQRPVQLTDEQKRAIWQAVADRSATASAQGEKVFAEPGTVLPTGMETEELPDTLLAQNPALRDLKYVKVGDKVLLVAPSNNIVRGVVEE